MSRRSSVAAFAVAVLLQALPQTAWGLDRIEIEPLQTKRAVDPKISTDLVGLKKNPTLAEESSSELKTLVGHRRDRVDSSVDVKNAAEAGIAKNEKLRADAEKENEIQKRQDARISAIVRSQLQSLMEESEDEEEASSEAPAERTARAATSERAPTEEKKSDLIVSADLDEAALRKALGDSFSITSNGKKLIIKGVTSKECYEHLRVQQRTHGSQFQFKISFEEAPVECLEARKVVTRSNRVDLAEQTDLQFDLPTTSADVCLAKEDVLKSGDDRFTCDPMLRILSEKDRKAEEAKKIAEQRDHIAELAMAVVESCAGSSSPEDWLEAEAAMKNVGLDDDLIKYQDKINGKRVKLAAAASVKDEEELERLVFKPMEGNERAEKALAEAKIRQALNKIFNTGLEPKEQKIEAEARIDELESLSFENKAAIAAVEKFKTTVKGELAKRDREEKTEKAESEIAERRSQVIALAKGNPADFNREWNEYRKSLTKHYQALGCAKAAQQPECKGLAARIQESNQLPQFQMQTQMLISQMNSVTTACNNKLMEIKECYKRTADLEQQKLRNLSFNPAAEAMAQQEAQQRSGAPALVLPTWQNQAPAQNGTANAGGSGTVQNFDSTQTAGSDFVFNYTNAQSLGTVATNPNSHQQPKVQAPIPPQNNTIPRGLVRR